MLAAGLPSPGMEAPSADPDAELLARMRAGDTAAFALLLRRHHKAVVRAIGAFVRRDAVVEELAQEAWLAVVRGLPGFEGRGSLRSWIVRIAVNTAKARNPREVREVPASSLGDEDDATPTVDPARFHADGRWVGHWSAPPTPWPDEQVHAAETRAAVERAIAELPAAQRQVFTLRDGLGLDADETCALVGVSAANQRVLLHRARARIRAILERTLGGAS